MFKDRLRALRKGRHLTLSQLAKGLNKKFHNDKKHLNTSPQIENWERGIRIPPYTEIIKLARYFNVSMDYIAGRSYNDKIDLANLFVGDKTLQFDGKPLSTDDRNEIYEIIRGYLYEKSHPVTKTNGHKRNQKKQTQLNLL
ncbi:helix-turn-helix domain-containing protein [Acetilactobacillus jinshanensis]|uniref:XRE family transcriptional regulator n=1 Tax=Acetilactobacillus jinshanensis TaxID=1720083 RepID=A0A4P6ZMG6_9LACO|nr:helix-turn-helix domain-containing protein [Acetilactobacillus jinshanensis]QBP18918.1 XRE family transcriptional regulator [Acetilactobacillus jinshanensis]URL60532.1 helix-turn-helix transcriptional regulator [uncultured bacterium]